jgi:transcription elongation factor Elf1
MLSCLPLTLLEAAVTNMCFFVVIFLDTKDKLFRRPKRDQRMRRTVIDPKKVRAEAMKKKAAADGSARPTTVSRNAQGYNQALKTFSCPLCLAPGSLQIALSVTGGRGTAVFHCVECNKEGRSGVGNIQYPYKMSFTPKLQKRVDVFFKFRDYVAECGLQGAAVAAGGGNMMVGIGSGAVALASGSLLGDTLLGVVAPVSGSVISVTDDENAAGVEAAGKPTDEKPLNDDVDDLDELFGGGDEEDPGLF